ncbi:MAG: glycosyltransferase [Synechococcus sp. s2_metabat2_7]|nr:glycosyltransferase [Synechococcus sp. s2_metabat2_7]
MKRVVPGLPGLRLQLDVEGKGSLVPPEQWSREMISWAPSRRMRLLQRYSLGQHGVDLDRLLQRHGLKSADLAGVYSPFFDALLCWPQVPQLITCHDFTPLRQSNSRKAWLRYRYWLPRHVRCARRLIAISRTVADQLIEFGAPASDVVVIPNGIALERPAVPAPGSEDLLVLARHDANKNLAALLKAMAGVQRLVPHWQGTLRIVGRESRLTPGLKQLVAQLPRPDQVQWVASLTREELLSQLRSSLALVSASTEEGFDYPVLEAKAEGIPTLISDISVHREFHNSSSLFFPIDDSGESLASHLKALCSGDSTWKQLSTQGYALAQSLSVERQQAAILSNLEAISG